MGKKANLLAGKFSVCEKVHVVCPLLKNLFNIRKRKKDKKIKIKFSSEKERERNSLKMRILLEANMPLLEMRKKVRFNFWH